MSSWLAVLRADTPTILLQIDITLAHCYHGLDSYTHTGLKHYPVTTSTIVRDLRIFVHLSTDAVSCQFSHDTITSLLAVILYCITDITEVSACYSILYTLIERLLSDFQQPFHILGDLTNAKRIAGISVKPIQKSATINRDDVSVFQYLFLIWDTMHYNVIDGSADAGRKRTAIGIRETFERGDSTMVANELISYLVQRQS